MRTTLVAGNWKMNLTSVQGAALVESLIKTVRSRPDVDVCVCPPYLSIPRIREQLRSQSVMMLGAQDVFWKDSGAFTGHVSPKQLHEFCVDFCIVGHSETRGKFGKLEIDPEQVSHFTETDQTVNLKIKALLFYGITPILCVGETLAEREAGQTDDIIRTQLRGALDGVLDAELYSFVIAYEPVWAIGTGKVCDTAEAQRVCAMIRAELRDLYDADVADSVRVLYGGSVKPDNAKELFAQPDIDGGLVGGASLEADSFSAIVMSA